MIKKKWTVIIVSGLLAALALGSIGCSRKILNQQLAENLGTVGKYENNEPVESPKMRAERELREAEQAQEEQLQQTLTAAGSLAAVYDYESALKELDKIEEEHQQDDRVLQAKIDYQQKRTQLEPYDGPIPHIYFNSLIIDTARAFDGDDNAESYNWWMTTADEFEKMMTSMYEKGYILMDIHETATAVTGEDGKITYTKNNPLVPEGKIPFVLSIDDVNYYEYTQEDGFAKSLTLDENGDVKNIYVDAQGTEHIGDYDVIPLLETFIKEHPDFSLRGARGIVAVTGYEGAFGYRVNDQESATYAGDCETVKKIAARLRETGWQIASNSYDHGHMNQMGYDSIVSDTEKWLTEIGSLVGETDILIYPYGEEIDPGERITYLVDQGFRYLCGVWSNQDFLSTEGSYVRQTRRNIDGYNLHNNPDSMREYFVPEEVLDPTRPPFQ